MGNECHTVLFVDDEQNILSSLRRLMYDEENWNTFFADSALKGLEILEKENVDIVISDVRMPGMDGIEFLKRVKKLYPHIIRIFLSGYADKKSVIQALSEGCAQQLLPKPWREPELKSIIKSTLLQSEDMKKKSPGLQKVINSLELLRPMPHVYMEIKKCLTDVDTLSIDKISAVIEKDTSITAELLRWANSALFGQANRVDTVNRAVQVLGIDIVEGLVLSESIFGTFYKSMRTESNFSIREFQTHSMASGIIARMLIGRLDNSDHKDSDRAFTAGLLHDLGKLVEEKCLTDGFIKVINAVRNSGSLIVDAEYEVFETTHEEIGRYLAGWWNLPSFLVNAIRWHHKPHCCNTDKDIISAVHIADILAQQLELGNSGNFQPPDAERSCWNQFNLTEEYIASIRENVEQHMPAFA